MLKILFPLGLATMLAAAKPAYDPLAVTDAEVKSETFDVQDQKRERVIPIRVYLPDTDKPAPVILFSHGLRGSRDNNPSYGVRSIHRNIKL